MATGGIRLTGAWDAYLKAMDARDFRARLARRLATAADRVGRTFVASVRREIRAGVYAPNSPVTVILKGSSKPLVDKGDLFQSMTYQVDGPYHLNMGVIRAKSGDKLVNVALIVHEGATINVKQHPKVRAKVWAMIRSKLSPEALAALNRRQRASVSSAAGTLGLSKKGHRWTERQRRWWFASHPSTAGSGPARDVWIIPARPYLARVAESSDFQRMIGDTYAQAVQAAFSGGS
jgi:hypothetical protein